MKKFWNMIATCGKQGHTPTYEEKLRERLKGETRFRAYRICRRAGLYPWCSLRFALGVRAQ